MIRHPLVLLALFVMLAMAPSGWVVPILAAMAAWSAARVFAPAHPVRLSTSSREQPRGTVVRLGLDSSGEEVQLGERELSAHGLILGASGAGKSTSLLAIISEQIARGAPVVAIDLKGSPAFARDLAAACAAAGRPFAVWTPDGPAHWNPLAHGNPTELKDKLIATERFTEPHYQRAAERYAQSALQVLHDAHPQRPPTLREVVEAMDPQRLGGMLRHLPGERATRVQDYVASLSPDQLSAIRGLGTRLAILSESHTGAYLEPVDHRETGASGSAPNPIDLRHALTGGQVVLFSLNSSRYGKLASQLGTLAVQDLVSAVGDRLGQDSRPQAIVAIDEFSALGADNVISLLARGREAGVSVMLATQELADLDRAARGLRDQVLGNTAMKLVHRQDVPASAQTIAQMAGTEKVWESTYQLGSGLLGDYDTTRGTRRETERFRVHPNKISSLRTGQAVLIANGSGAPPRTVHVRAPRRPRRSAPTRPERPAPER